MVNYKDLVLRRIGLEHGAGAIRKDWRACWPVSPNFGFMVLKPRIPLAEE